MKNSIQKFGKFLSSMVMPNIGALIAFGFLAALFIDTGWLPNKQLSTLVGPMLTYLIPVLIASTGGYLIAGDRGRVIGAIAVIGAILSDLNITMLMGAMIMGPLAGWVIKTFDKFMEERMPAGFEMLINNFSIGILGMLLAIFGYFAVGPVMAAILAVLSTGVDTLVQHNLLPLIAVFIEPAKVLFLNNAINHGIFTPLATAQVLEHGKSILYMLEANPGPGFGVLLAYMFFCKDKTTKDSAPSAIIIHLFGGIHEIYFPYVLMNPMVIIAPIIGNVAAIFWFSMTGAGLAGPASPGSIIAFMMMAPGSDTVIVLTGVLIAAAVSFAIATPIIKMAGSKSLEEAQNEVAARKAESKGQPTPSFTGLEKTDVKKIIFACDAGMGSSAMGATKFRNRIKSQRPEIVVKNTSVDNIPADCDIAVVQTTLADRARKSAPQAQLITIGNFLADPALDALYVQLTTGDAPASEAEAAIVEQAESEQPANHSTVIVREGIVLGERPETKEEAIARAGKLLVKLGYVDESYIPAMLEREKLVSTYMGMGVAIPHGTSQAKGTVKKSGIVCIQYPQGVYFGSEKAHLIFGIAGVGDEHLEILANICTMLEDEKVLEELKTTKDVDWVLSHLS